MSTETPFRIEPCLLDDYPASLADVIADLVSAASVLGGRLHPASAASLAELVRLMNCYYSNLIEGHNTRPRDIERALSDDLEADTKRRNLQVEARAHVRVQGMIDALCASGTYGEATTRERIRWLHRRFYEELPQSLLRVEHGKHSYDLIPGEFRSGSEKDVVVGRHLPPSGKRVEEFMEYFERRYRIESLGTSARVFSLAAAHHRFNFIHPFPDGNGRVSRLMSHAMAFQAGIGAHGLWSISRGLARGLTDPGEYMRMMDLADSPRRSDTDGRGNLSREALIDFVMWFCRVALDQVRFMTTEFDLQTLEGRLQRYVRESLGLPDYAAALPVEVLRRGELPRGEAGSVTRRPERTARAVLRALTDAGLLASDTPKGPVRLRFSVQSADVLFPRLFGGQPTGTTSERTQAHGDN